MLLKRFSLFVICSVLGFVNLLADQKGDVKTIGRYKQPGEAVGGVIVRIHGKHNPVITDNNGAFTLVLKDLKEGDAYQFESIRKANYELLDQSLIGRDIAYSSTVPFTIVVVDKTKMEKERAAMQERFEKMFEDKYNKRIEEIETSFANKLISYEQRIDSLEQVENNYEQSKSRANDMINYFLRVNYDELDSLDQEINYLIEQGEFDEARMLILSKGNIEERTRRVEALQHTTEKETQSLVRDLLNLYEICMAKAAVFEAGDYACKAYQLAPENYDAIFAYTHTLFYTNSMGLEWEKMERKHYQYVSSHYSKDSEEYLRALSHMEIVYRSRNSDSCIVFLRKKLSILDKQESPDLENLDYTIRMLAYHYSRVGDIKQAEKLLKRSEAIVKELNRPDDMFTLYFDYSLMYLRLNQPKKEKFYDLKMMECFEQLDSTASDINSTMIKLYLKYDQKDKALALALSNVDVILNENGNRINNQVSYAYEQIANVYESMQDYGNAIQYQLRAIETDDTFSLKKMSSSVFRRIYLAELYAKAGNMIMLDHTLEEIYVIYPDAGVPESNVNAYNISIANLQATLQHSKPNTP